MSADGRKAPRVDVFKAARASKKGEDAAAICLPVLAEEKLAGVAAFAIFDGHSGKEAGIRCAEMVCQRLIAKGPPFEPAAIADMLWAVDEEVGRTAVRDGATAQILLVEPVEDRLKCTLAWCGDSSAVVTNTCDPAGTVFYATESHTAGPDHQGGGRYADEKLRLEFYSAVRAAVEAEGIDTLRDETTAEMVRAAIAKVQTSMHAEADVALLVKAFRRGKIIAETHPDGCESRKNLFVRQRDVEHDPNQVWVVATATERSDPGYSDLQMTRSMLDWRAADMVLPEPQIHSFEVPADGLYRVCLASDGLWDVCDFAVAARHMVDEKTIGRAARRLLRIAEDEYLTNRGHEMMDDDTTVLVVELNPSGTPYAGGSSGGACCVVA